MIELTNAFILSQALMLLAMLSDFLSFQFKKREYTLACFAISAALISAHYLLLGAVAAGVIVFFSVLRFITALFTTDKRIRAVFLVLNAASLVFTYKAAFDLIIFIGISLNIVATFQDENRKMRQIMMAGTSLVIIYNIMLFTPMGILVEGLFLGSNILGYYRHYVRTSKRGRGMKGRRMTKRTRG